MAHHFLLPTMMLVLVGGLLISHCSPHVLQTNLERSPKANYGHYDIQIEDVPWQVYVKSGQDICTGSIIHTNWVLVLSSCKIVNGNGSDIQVQAGGETPDKIKQVVSAEIHGGNSQPELGFTLVHLKDSLKFDEYVQPARLPREYLELIWFSALVTGFSFKENDKQLTGYDAIYNRSVCPSEEYLCAFGNVLPLAESSVGIDFLDMFEYQDSSDNLHFCLIGGRKESIGDLYQIHYSIIKIIPWLQDELGLKLKPTPPAPEPGARALCGLLE